MLNPRPTPTPGRIVRVRQRTWMVDQVHAGRMDHESALLHLSCLDDDAPGA